VFAQLFTRTPVIERYWTAPLLDDRLRFLTQCAAQGAARATLREIAWRQLALLAELDLASGRRIRPEEIEVAADRWGRRHRAARASQIKHIAVARHWLQFLGRLVTPATPPAPEFVDPFIAYMRDERGLSPITIYTRRKRVEEFLAWLAEKGRTLPALSISEVDAALQQKRLQTGCTRASLRTYAYVLRAFLRYAERRGWCRVGLAAGILPPRVYRNEGLPAGPTWPDVQRLCATAVGEGPGPLRDRAVLLLFAVYGLRASEVRRLRLEDLDWRQEVLHVRRSKQRPHTQLYPLSPTVGEAILAYLRHGRPPSSHREVFLSLKAPVRPLGSSALWQLVSRRLRLLGLALPHVGPHTLRHAAATRLLAAGCSLKTIGDYLGHQSAAATSGYAKVDLPTLREVAAFGLEGLR